MSAYFWRLTTSFSVSDVYKAMEDPGLVHRNKALTSKILKGSMDDVEGFIFKKR